MPLRGFFQWQCLLGLWGGLVSFSRAEERVPHPGRSGIQKCTGLEAEVPRKPLISFSPRSQTAAAEPQLSTPPGTKEACFWLVVRGPERLGLGMRVGSEKRRRLSCSASPLCPTHTSIDWVQPFTTVRVGDGYPQALLWQPTLHSASLPVLVGRIPILYVRKPSIAELHPSSRN